MNTNEIRFYLHNYEKLKKEIQALSESLKEYRLMDGIKPKIITDMPTSHSTSSTVELVVVNRFDYVAGLEAEIDSKMRILNAINSVYFYLKEPARTIIEMRYFLLRDPEDIRRQKYNWQEIADETNYTEIYCKKVDSKVILKIQSKIMGQ